jgi:hypothetical protein
MLNQTSDNIFPGDIVTNAISKLEVTLANTTLALTAAVNDIESRLGEKSDNTHKHVSEDITDAVSTGDDIKDNQTNIVTAKAVYEFATEYLANKNHKHTIDVTNLFTLNGQMQHITFNDLAQNHLYITLDNGTNIGVKFIPIFDNNLGFSTSGVSEIYALLECEYLVAPTELIDSNFELFIDSNYIKKTLIGIKSYNVLTDDNREDTIIESIKIINS